MKNMMKRLTSSFGILMLLFLSINGTTRAAEPMKILFIGNSYTHMNDMPFIFEKISTKSGKDVLVAMSAKSGASFREHSSRIDMYDAIKGQAWDYVILQGYSRELSFSKDYIDTATVPFVSQILDSIYANNACTNVMFYMTWGYADGFPDRIEIDNYEKMADSVCLGYKYLGELYNIPVVPVGMVWKEVKEKTRIDLYNSDRAHPSKEGSYLIASTFFGAIFNEPIKDNYIKSVRNRHSKLINDYMFSYVRNHDQEYNLDKNRYTGSSLTSKKGEFIFDYRLNYSDATDVVINFGDGTSSKNLSGRHIFDNPGTYTISIHIKDQCGIRDISQDVLFNPLRKPRRWRRSKRKKG